MFQNAADTLTADTAMLNALRANEDFDYTREMVQSDFSVGQWIASQLSKMFDAVFGSRFYNDNETLIWTLVVLGCIAGVAALIVRFRPALFGSSGRKTPVGYEVAEDTIYGVDFPAEIAAAMEREDWRGAVRMTYLYVLKQLEDEGRIIWEPSKTPTQYTAEVATTDFRYFSDMFLRVRYGNFPATRETIGEMTRIGGNIVGKAPERTPDTARERTSEGLEGLNGQKGGAG
ncbi:MAG: DUF4129 domain-containing protein [Prevotella sp.]|nr:DUF4129 domain-containing protein [Prevotella sp.]